MQLVRSRFTLVSRRFGRGPAWIITPPAEPHAFTLSDEVKLFATTFAGGFIFISLLLA